MTDANKLRAYNHITDVRARLCPLDDIKLISSPQRLQMKKLLTGLGGKGENVHQGRSYRKSLRA